MIVATPSSLEFGQRVGGDGFDLGNHEVRFLLLNYRPQSLAIQHGNDMGSIRHLHGGSIGIGIDGDHLHSVALELDDNLLSEFARAAEQRLFCCRGEGRPN